MYIFTKSTSKEPTISTRSTSKEPMLLGTYNKEGTYALNSLDTVSKGSTVFRNPRALSSALAALGTLQPRALGFLNTVDPLDTVSNCYLVVWEQSCTMLFSVVL